MLFMGDETFTSFFGVSTRLENLVCVFQDKVTPITMTIKNPIYSVFMRLIPEESRVYVRQNRSNYRANSGDYLPYLVMSDSCLCKITVLLQKRKLML